MNKKLRQLRAEGVIPGFIGVMGKERTWGLLIRQKALQAKGAGMTTRQMAARFTAWRKKHPKPDLCDFEPPKRDTVRAHIRFFKEHGMLVAVGDDLWKLANCVDRGANDG